MSAGTIEQNGAVVESPRHPTQSAVRVVEDDGPLSHLMDTARFEHLYRIANTMAALAFLPDHLLYDSKTKASYPTKTVAANCFLIVNQALRWGVDPFALAPETYVVSGKLGYQGKLVAAIVNTRAGLKHRLAAKYDGAGDGRRVIISGTFNNEEEPRTIELTLSQAKTANDMWRKDPDQKLWYSGVTKWARRHCPEVLLGVLTEDDVERIGSTPIATVSTVQERTDEPQRSKADELIERMRSTRNPGQSEPASEQLAADMGAAPANEPSVSAPAPLSADEIRQKIVDSKTVEEIMRVKRLIDDVPDQQLREVLYAEAKAHRALM